MDYQLDFMRVYEEKLKLDKELNQIKNEPLTDYRTGSARDWEEKRNRNKTIRQNTEQKGKKDLNEINKQWKEQIVDGTGQEERQVSTLSPDCKSKLLNQRRAKLKMILARTPEPEMNTHAPEKENSANEEKIPFEKLILQVDEAAVVLSRALKEEWQKCDWSEIEMEKVKSDLHDCELEMLKLLTTNLDENDPEGYCKKTRIIDTQITQIKVTRELLE